MLIETDEVVYFLHKATLLVADATNSFELTGNGDVLEPEGGVVAIGSGGSYALGTVDMQKEAVRCCVDNLLVPFMPLTIAYCISGSACFDGPACSGCRGHREKVHEDRGGYLRVHKQQPSRGED